MPASRRIFSVTGTGPVSMIVGSVPIFAVALMRARGFRSWRTPKSRSPIRSAAAPSTMPRGVAGVVDVGDALELGVLEDRHGVEAGHGLAHVLEGGLERAERLHVGLGAHVLVAVEERQAVDVGDRDDRAGEAALGPGAGGALLALDGVGVDVVAGEAELGGDDVGADALRDEVGLEGERRVDGDRGAVGAHRRRGSSSRRRRRRSRRRCRGTWLAARFTASRPEAQKRLSARPGTCSGRSESRTAERARQPPCSATWVTLPQITSSTPSVAVPVRARSAFRVSAERRTAVISCSAPSGRPLPRGVRIAS